MSATEPVMALETLEVIVFNGENSHLMFTSTKDINLALPQFDVGRAAFERLAQAQHSLCAPSTDLNQYITHLKYLFNLDLSDYSVKPLALAGGYKECNA